MIKQQLSMNTFKLIPENGNDSLLIIYEKIPVLNKVPHTKLKARKQINKQTGGRKWLNKKLKK